MKVHVTLRDDVRRDPAAKESALKKVVEVSGIHDVNQKRFERFGIITGDLDDDSQMTALKGLGEVSSVEKDTEKHALEA